MTGRPPVAQASTPLPPLPPLGADAPFTLPRATTRQLGPGLRLIAVPRADTSTVDVRVQIPYVARDARDTALAELLTAVLFSGTARLGTHTVRWDTALRTGRLQARRTTEWLVIAGHCRSDELPHLLALLGERLACPDHDEDLVRAQAERIARAAEVLRTDPRRTALRTLRRLRHGDLGCFEDLPAGGAADPPTAREVAAAHVRLLTRPPAEVLLVGGVNAQTAAEPVRRAFAHRQGCPLPDPALPAPLPAARPAAGAGPRRVVVHRPASAQSTLALAWDCLPFEDSRHTAQAVANAVFSGYFSSRLVARLREREGLTYQATSRFDRVLGTMSVVLEASCAPAETERTVRAVLDEARRMVTDPPTPAETAHARRFLAGSLLMATASPTDLANLVSSLSCWGVGVGWTEEYPRRLALTSDGEVARAAARVFGRPPTAVAVGDPAALTEPLGRLGFVPHGAPPSPAPTKTGTT
ncbi:M16 family metallopeptidase [Streptomyces sp. NPDC127106]|uniref:M16 family metallopeptidase n=1 Tax=Streptomyces sp. NPDC127106 TaxID=3345360 RepID=UPI003628CFD8